MKDNKRYLNDDEIENVNGGVGAVSNLASEALEANNIMLNNDMLNIKSDPNNLAADQLANNQIANNQLANNQLASNLAANQLASTLNEASGIIKSGSSPIKTGQKSFRKNKNVI